MRYTAILPMSFLLCSATTAVDAQDITGPGIENLQSVSNYLRSLSLSVDDLYYLKPAAFLDQMKENRGIPIIHIYNKDGYFVKYTFASNSLGCIDPTDALKNLPTTLNNPVDSSLTLQRSLSRLAPYKRPTVPIHGKPAVLIYWMKYRGAERNFKIQDWEEAVIGVSPEMRIIKVSMDAQGAWSKEEQEEVLSFWTQMYSDVDAAQQK